MADWTDFYTSGEARRIFEEGERRNVEAFLRAFGTRPFDLIQSRPRDTSIVTFKDWLDARGA